MKLWKWFFVIALIVTPMASGCDDDSSRRHRHRRPHRHSSTEVEVELKDNLLQNDVSSKEE